MVSIEDVPAELRWEIATKSATAVPMVYDLFFRKALGKKYDEIELAIWREGGKEVKSLAEALGFPAGNAREIAETSGVISEILYGPELVWATLEESENRVVSRVTECPMLNRAVELGLEPEKIQGACQAFNKSAVENLNQKFTQRFERSMCAGDPHCQNVIERRR